MLWTSHGKKRWLPSCPAVIQEAGLESMMDPLWSHPTGFFCSFWFCVFSKSCSPAATFQLARHGLIFPVVKEVCVCVCTEIEPDTRTLKTKRKKDIFVKQKSTLNQWEPRGFSL